MEEEIEVEEEDNFKLSFEEKQLQQWGCFLLYNTDMGDKSLIKYINKWVALTPNRKKVVAFASDIKTLDKQVNKLSKNKDLIYHRVLPVNSYYSPKCHG